MGQGKIPGWGGGKTMAFVPSPTFASSLAMETKIGRRRGEQEVEDRSRGFEGFLKKPKGRQGSEEKESDRW